MDDKPLFEVFKEIKIRALCRDDDFFNKLYNDVEVYFNNNFLKGFFVGKNFTKEEKATTGKQLFTLHLAQSKGYLDVQWDRLFNLKKKESFIEIVQNRYKQIVEIEPSFEKHFEDYLNWYNGYYRKESLTLEK